MTRFILKSAMATALAVSMISMGCGGKSGPEMAKVSGIVTVQGKTMTKGSISFIATDPIRGNANSKIGPDGSYNLQTREPGDGAELGSYTIMVSDLDPDSLNTAAPGEPVKKHVSDIPKKYENPTTSGISKTVARGSNVFDIQLD